MSREIDKLVAAQTLCGIAFKGAEYPYMTPFQYARIDGTLYFHFTDYGRKMRLLEKDSRACVEIKCCTKNLGKYRFVVLSGKLKAVTNQYERQRAMKGMSEHGKRWLSENFPAAHGIEPKQGWSSLAEGKSLV